jgi:hypothetical protein
MTRVFSSSLFLFGTIVVLGCGGSGSKTSGPAPNPDVDPGPPAFTVAAIGTNIMMNIGEWADLTLTLAPVNDYDGVVDLSMTTSLPDVEAAFLDKAGVEITQVQVSETVDVTVRFYSVVEDTGMVGSGHLHAPGPLAATTIDLEVSDGTQTESVDATVEVRPYYFYRLGGGIDADEDGLFHSEIRLRAGTIFFVVSDDEVAHKMEAPSATCDHDGPDPSDFHLPNQTTTGDFIGNLAWNPALSADNMYNLSDPAQATQALADGRPFHLAGDYGYWYCGTHGLLAHGWMAHVFVDP